MTPLRQTRRDFLRASARLAGGLSATAAAWAQNASVKRPNIVLIVLDTVRRDHISGYGHFRPTTPFLDSLAPSSRVYRRAYSTASWTFPAHASLFSGLHLISRGAHWEHLKFDEGVARLPEILGNQGYQTRGFSGNPFVSKRNGFAKGFEHFEDYNQSVKTICAGFGQCLAQLGREPFFIFINFSEAHDPYGSSGPFFKTFLTDPAYADAYDIKHPRLHPGRGFSQEWLKHLGEHYDAEIRYVDHGVEQVVNDLKAAGVWESTLLIVLSDHGENLGEHGLLNHQYCVYETLVRIPLIVHYPELFPPGSQEPNPVQISDIFPTVLSAAGADPGSFPSQGHSLLPGTPSPDRVVLCEYYRHPGLAGSEDGPARHSSGKTVQDWAQRFKAVVAGDLKFIRASKGGEELYDLEKDPWEETDLVEDPAFAPARDKMAALLEQRLDECRAFGEASFEKEEMDEETKSSLKALGYL